MFAEVQVLLGLLRDLRVIERRTGARFDLPEEVSAKEVHHIRETAAFVSRGDRELEWTSATLVVLEPAVQALRDGGVMLIEAQASTAMLGHEVELGVVRRELPAYEFVDATPAEGQEGSYRVSIKPAGATVGRTREVLMPKTTAPPQRGRGRRRKRKRG